MKSVNREAHLKLFSSVYQGMINRSGHLGNVPFATWHFDYEPAAVQGCQDVFGPAIKIFGCAFHFAKALNKRRDHEGLRVPCTEGTHESNSLKKWFRRARHLCFIPDHLRINFSHDLNNVPIHTSPIVNAQVAVFCGYFRDFWLNNSTITPLWGQFGNIGPRTTNLVEGWHNGLKSRIHGGTHPTIAELVDFWQLCQHSAQYRIQALLPDPLAMAKSQTADVFRRNQLLQDEMNNFANYLSAFPVAYIDVINYLDRVCAIGIVPQQI
jgi:hypothetical protein